MSKEIILLQLSTLLIISVLLTRLFKFLKINLPDVTIYLLTGVIAGPYLLGKIGVLGLGLNTIEQVDNLAMLSDVVLGFIAFSIGKEFKISELKKIGKKATIIGTFQAVFTTLLLDVVLIGIHYLNNSISIPAALVIGAIGAATAPATTLMVIRQYNAKGKITDLLLPIIAVCDAVCLIVYAVSLGIAQALVSEQLNLVSILVNPIVKIIGSLILGFILGSLLTTIVKKLNNIASQLAITIGFIVLGIALSTFELKISSLSISFNNLLVNMMMAAVLCNGYDNSKEIIQSCASWSSPLLILFFIIAGAGLEFSVFSDSAMILIGIIYVVVRCLGKSFGSAISGKMMKCEPEIIKYLGITLYPQEGIAIGMVNTAAILGGSHALIIRNTVLFGILIYELFSPTTTKLVLQKTHEINIKGEEKC